MRQKKDMNIYIAFSSHIEKIFRVVNDCKEGPLCIKKGVRSIKMWKKKYPYMHRWQLMKQPDIYDLFMEALMQIDGNTPIESISSSYELACCEDEYKRMTIAQRKRFTPFKLPEWIPDGTKQKPVSRRCCMDKKKGQLFRQAIIHCCYEKLAEFMYERQEKEMEKFQPVLAIREFCDKYNLSVEENANLLRQYYRHPACI